jgi:probable rRNA maturation factor
VLRVVVTDRTGRPLRVPGVAAWLARVAPPAARGDVAIALVSDRAIRTLNRDYRHKDLPTDVLSFPTHPYPKHLAHPAHLGDIVIATGVARRQAREAGHSYATELKVLALHGLLHLLGYDHHAASDRGRMARLERRLRAKGRLGMGLIERASGASEPRERSAPAPFDFAQGAVSASRTAKRRARARVGESEGRRPSGRKR